MLALTLLLCLSYSEICQKQHISWQAPNPGWVQTNTSCSAGYCPAGNSHLHSVPAARLHCDKLDGLFEVSRDTVNVHECGSSPGQAKRNSCGEELQYDSTMS